VLVLTARVRTVHVLTARVRTVHVLTARVRTIHVLTARVQTVHVQHQVAGGEEHDLPLDDATNQNLLDLLEAAAGAEHNEIVLSEV
jgi:hypothetical protein